jgi:hypothetical protein
MVGGRTVVRFMEQSYRIRIPHDLGSVCPKEVVLRPPCEVERPAWFGSMATKQCAGSRGVVA